MKDLGHISFVLGIQILRDYSQGIIQLSQKIYVYINKVENKTNKKDNKLGYVSIIKGDY